LKKRFFSLLLCTVLILSLCPSALAVPDSVVYSSTRNFLAMLDESKTRYTWAGIDSDNEEHVTVGYYIGENEDFSINVDLFFTEDNSHASLRVWNLIDFEPADLQAMYKVCNDLNNSFRYTCFYVDESDNSVNCSMDLIFTEETAGSVTSEALLRIMLVCDKALPTLLPGTKPWTPGRNRAEPAMPALFFMSYCADSVV